MKDQQDKLENRAIPAAKLDSMGRPPVLALTATPAVTVDIVRQLDIPDATVVNVGSYRENLCENGLSGASLSGLSSAKTRQTRQTRQTE
jgi:hypothetical protein